ncbi:MAG: alpha-E domain-containing protein [Burkholderiales bacterium]|jgi:uncharacterized alpha-E superfamily protein
MISRVAESAFWLARYLERVEDIARMLYVNINFVLDVNLEGVPRWWPLVVAAGAEKEFRARAPEASRDDGETVQEFLCWDRDHPSSIASSLDRARENARTIRETISLEMWETLNGLSLWFNSADGRRRYQRERFEFYQYLRDQCVLFQGFALDTMLQSEAYHFMRLGTSLERAGQTARILDVKYHALGPTGRSIEWPREIAQWQAILRSCSAIEPYFKVAQGELSGQQVAEFLLFDEDFPHSVLRSLDQAQKFMQLVRPRGKAAHSMKALNLLRNQLDAMSMDEVVMQVGLHKTLMWIVNSVADVCAAVENEYFLAPTQVRRHRTLPRRRLAKSA